MAFHEDTPGGPREWHNLVGAGGKLVELAFDVGSPDSSAMIRFGGVGTAKELEAVLARNKALSEGFEAWIGVPVENIKKLWMATEEEAGEARAVKKVPPVPEAGIQSPAQQIEYHDAVEGDWLAEVLDAQEQPWVVYLGDVSHPLVEYLVYAEWARIA